MKKFKNLFLLLFLINTFIYGKNTPIIFTQEEQNFIKSHPTIKVGIEKDWPPFAYFENNHFLGISKDYLDLISKITNLKFEIYSDSWDKLLLKAKNKEIDLLPILSKTKEREKYLSYTDTYLTLRNYVFVKKDTYINNINELKNKTVAIPKGFVQEEYFKKMYPKIKTIYTNTLLGAIDAVITEKADFFISNNAAINFLTKKYNISDLKATFHIGYEGSELNMAVRDDFIILRNILQKALNTISFQEKNSISEKWLNKIPKELNINISLTPLELEFLKNKQKLIIANEKDWKPFDFFENGQAKGYVIDYMKLISQKLGLETEFITDSWSGLLNKFKTSQIDILPVVSYNKKRENYMNFSKPFLNQNTVIVTKSSRNDIINIDDLKDKKIAMMKDWNLTNTLRKNYEDINIIEFESLNDIFDAIKSNFVDASIQNDILAKYYINQNYQGNLKVSARVKLKDIDNKLFIGINKNLPILNTIINKAIDSLNEKELEILHNKWINTKDELNLSKEELNFIKNTTINVTATTIWAPFNFLENNKYQGLSYDLFNYIKKSLNLNTKLNYKSTFTEALESIKNKENDIILGTSQTKERREYAIFSNNYFTSPIGIATLQDKNYIKDPKELLGKKVGVGKNFSAHKLLEKDYPNMDFVFVKDIQEGLEYLSQNKIYAYVDIMPVLTYNIKKYGFTNIKITGDIGKDFDIQFMIRDDYPLLQSIINKSLIAIPFEEKEKIFNKWYKVNFEEKTDYSLIWKIIAGFILVIIFILYKNRQLQNYKKSLEKSQLQLENSIENFKTLIDFNIAGILIVQEGKIIYTNEEMANILGYKQKTSLLNKNLKKFIIPIKNNTKNKDLINIDESYEYEAVKIDLTKIPIFLKTKKLLFNNKNSQIISIVDLTEIKRNEEVLSQHSKMASLGEMIGNIAHQWRQPLSLISTTASGIKIQKELHSLDDEQLYDYLDTITDTTIFLSQTIDDFRNYIKEDKVKKVFDIKNSVNKVLNLMKSSFTNHRIDIETNLTSIQINSYENELVQALLNIISNSKDALVQNNKENQRYIYISTFKESKKAIIEIIDNGGGIKKDILSKVFEPYFTTKHQSQGTGLGLYMTHNIIKKSMQGEILIENIPFKEFKKCTKISLVFQLS